MKDVVKDNNFLLSLNNFFNTFSPKGNMWMDIKMQKELKVFISSWEAQIIFRQASPTLHFYACENSGCSSGSAALVSRNIMLV